MKISTFAEQLKKKIKEAEISDGQDDLIATGRSLSHIREIVLELKQFTTAYQFPDAQEEITFFKEIKPVLLSQYYYQRKVFELRLFKSFNEPKKAAENCYSELAKMQQYIKKNRSFYEYCISGETHLDGQYFVRGQSSPLSINSHEKFTTGYDIKLSIFLSQELIKDFIKRELLVMQSTSIRDNNSLTWTGSKTDLIELIYALQAAGVFNNAQADIRNIVSAFQYLFKIDLGNYSRTFLGIRIRKKTGQTAFMDQLRQVLVQRINQIENEST